MTGLRAYEEPLRNYYDAELAERARAVRTGHRADFLREFLGLLASEGRTTLVEVGAGAGQDGAAFNRAGLTYEGIDLSSVSSQICAGLGLRVQQASALAMPFPDRSFDAGWSMSTLMHVPDERIGQALAELRRVIRPTGLVGLGTWGARDPMDQREQVLTGQHGPRIFALRTDQTWLSLLESLGEVVQFRTAPAKNWHYQYALVRVNEESGGSA